MELYVRGKDDGLYRVRQAPAPPQRTKWQRWEALGGAFASGAAALSADGLAQVFAIGPDRAVRHRASSSPPARTPRRRGHDGGRGRAGAPRRRVVALGLARRRGVGGPAAVQRADGLIDVLVRGADRNLYRKPQVLGAAGST